MNLPKPPARSNPSAENVLHYEIVQEQAAALGRLGCALAAALAALSRFDRAQAEHRRDSVATAASGKALRARLVDDASYALWCFIIQREACGLRDEPQVVSTYGVPREVRNRMGAFGSTRPERAASSTTLPTLFTIS
jgi:hypothetical protein